MLYLREARGIKVATGDTIVLTTVLRCGQCGLVYCYLQWTSMAVRLLTMLDTQSNETVFIGKEHLTIET